MKSQTKSLIFGANKQNIWHKEEESIFIQDRRNRLYRIKRERVRRGGWEVIVQVMYCSFGLHICANDRISLVNRNMKRWRDIYITENVSWQGLGIWKYHRCTVWINICCKFTMLWLHELQIYDFKAMTSCNCYQPIWIWNGLEHTVKQKNKRSAPVSHSGGFWTFKLSSLYLVQSSDIHEVTVQQDDDTRGGVKPLKSFFRILIFPNGSRES